MNSQAEFDNTPDPRALGIPVPAADGSRQLSTARDSGEAALPYGSLFDEPHSTFDLLKYWGLLLKHRWVFVAGVVVALCLGYGVTFLTTPMYRAVATIKIDREEAAKIVGLDDVRAAAVDEAQFYQTQYELLKSRSLAERVVADLDLADRPDFVGAHGVSPWVKLRQIVFGGQASQAVDLRVRKSIAIARVQGGLSVKPVPNSALVALNFEDPSATWARDVVNAIAQAFIKTNLENRYEATAYARNFLQDQLAQIKLKLEQSERDLVAYAQRNRSSTWTKRRRPSPQPTCSRSIASSPRCGPSGSRTSNCGSKQRPRPALPFHNSWPIPRSRNCVMCVPASKPNIRRSSRPLSPTFRTC